MDFEEKKFVWVFDKLVQEDNKMTNKIVRSGEHKNVHKCVQPQLSIK